jgi:hypothetical protein
VNVVLPYSAFDQQATYPIYPNATNYFPIRRADNDTQYTIGRVFFQEAYVRIDYDRGNFSVHQALFPATNEKAEIVPIITPKTGDKGLQHGTQQPVTLTKGQIAGLSIGCVTVVTLIVCMCLWLLRRHGKMGRKEALAAKETSLNMELADQPKVETDGVAYYEKDSRPVVEMEGYAQHELQNPDHESDSLNARRSMPDLDTIFELYENTEFSIQDPDELYEMDNTEIGTRGLEFVVPMKNRPPPGWI